MRALTAAAVLLLAASTTGIAAEVQDDLGRSISMAQPAQRIVTLAPHATELVLAAGAGDRLVGIAAGGGEPGHLSGLPRISGPGGLDREALLALQPDLVIAWQSGNRATDLEWIARSGATVYHTEPTSLHDISRAMRDIGSLSDKGYEAGQAARTFEQALLTPCSLLQPKPVYIAVWEQPEMTVGGRHWINAVLRSAGYRNVFAYLETGVFKVAPEAVYRYRGLQRITLIRSFDASETDLLADRLSRPGPRLAEAIRMLCRHRLEPEQTDSTP